MSLDVFTPEDLANFFWNEGDLSYKFDNLQTSINDSVMSTYRTHKKTGVLSSRQIGKSFWVLCFAIGFLIRNPKTICRVIAPTKDKTDEIVEDNFNVIVNDIPNGLIVRSTTKHRYNFFNGSSLRMGALERQYVDKNRGGNASLIIYEECGFVSPDDFLYGVNSVIGPQLLRSKGNEIFVSSPSEVPDHPLHTVIAPECEKMGSLFDYTVFESDTITNEAIIEAATRSRSRLTEEFVIEVRTKVKNSRKKVDAAKICTLAKKHPEVHISDDFKREYLAAVIRPLNLMVIPVFKPETTLVEMKMPDICRKTVVIDWGGVRDKTVALLMFYNFNKDEDWVIDEMVFEPNTPTSEIHAKLRSWEDIHQIFARWADVPGQLQVDLYERFGYMVQVPPKNNWMAGVNVMASKFALDKIKIYPHCEFLIDSVKNGIFNKTRTDFDRTESLGHMDALAALMYGIRVQDRTNPYEGNTYTPPDLIFIPPDSMQSKEQATVTKLTGRRFGKYRK